MGDSLVLSPAPLERGGFALVTLERLVVALPPGSPCHAAKGVQGGTWRVSAWEMLDLHARQQAP